MAAEGLIGGNVYFLRYNQWPGSAALPIVVIGDRLQKEQRQRYCLLTL